MPRTLFHLQFPLTTGGTMPNASSRISKPTNRKAHSSSISLRLAGKPLFLARHGTKLFFGLPGNPLSAHLCFHRYIAPTIRLMGGHAAEESWFHGTLTEPLDGKGGRTRFILAVAEGDREAVRVTPRNGVSSADIFGASGANCYLRVPSGVQHLDAGETLPGQWLGERRWTT